MPEIVGRLRPPRLAAAPSSPALGEQYYDTVLNALMTWNGTVWLLNGATPWATYTPAWGAATTAPAIGNSTFPSARWSQHGKIVTVSTRITFGSTATYGSGLYFFGLPVPAPTNLSAIICGSCQVYDTSAGQMFTGVARHSSAGTGTAVQLTISATTTFDVTHNVPFIFAVGDHIQFFAVYEAA